MRPVCKACNRNLCAINGYHNDKVYYRSRCNTCIRKGKRLPRQKPRWQQAGYAMKPVCDVCGFRARFNAQLTVWHVNGRINDCDPRNLKTVCLNCTAEISRLDRPWKRGDLEEDR